MTFDATNAVRLLTMTSLGGLLFAVGLRLNWSQLANSFDGIRPGRILLINFLLVPIVNLGVTLGLRIPTNIAVGMLLLAAAPFAPVVPIFVRMAKGNMALAGTLTALFPFFSAFLTPLVCEWSLRPFLGDSSLKFNTVTILIVLISTITLPMAAGVLFNHYFPAITRKVLRPLEILSEATGAVSLTFVTVVEFKSIISTGWKPLLAMALMSELSFLIGYFASGPYIQARRVVAFGTSNRNIALALLIAIQSFPGTSVVAAVVAYGLVLIFLGLLHVGFWRFCASTDDRNRLG